jgi:hypothetical protein
MSRSSTPVSRLGRFASLCALLCAIAACSAILAGNQQAHAYCSTSLGQTCLPGSGYTLDNYFCGVVMSQGTSCSDGSNHSYGFVSADVAAGVSACAWAEHQVGGGDEFSGCGTGVARSCFYNDCHDQSVFNDLVAAVVQNSSGGHQLNGRGMA